MALSTNAQVAEHRIAQAVITLVAASSRGYVLGGLGMLYYMDTHRHFG